MIIKKLIFSLVIIILASLGIWSCSIFTKALIPRSDNEPEIIAEMPLDNEKSNESITTISCKILIAGSNFKDVVRCIDPEFGVVCYRVRTEGDSFDCITLPDSTRLSL